MRETTLKKAADFVTAGRALGIHDDALFAMIADGGVLNSDDWYAFVAWFSIGK